MKKQVPTLILYFEYGSWFQTKVLNNINIWQGKNFVEISISTYFSVHRITVILKVCMITKLLTWQNCKMNKVDKYNGVECKLISWLDNYPTYHLCHVYVFLWQSENENLESVSKWNPVIGPLQLEVTWHKIQNIGEQMNVPDSGKK